jgi:hypothetical protein
MSWRRFSALALALACSGQPAQREITAPGELLGADGEPREIGWSPRQLLTWNPERVADRSRLRQWDFFTVVSGEAAVNLTLVDLGFLRAGTVGVVDLATGERSETLVIAGHADDFALSPALEGVAAFPRAGLRFETGPEISVLTVDVRGASVGPDVRGTLTLRRRAAMPYLSLVTPFPEDPTWFFFEQKVPGMTADGTLSVGGRERTFAGATATIDWGRGVWPSQVTWRWAAGSGLAGGVPVAFNLGDGIGEASAATENLVVLGDAAHKIGAVAWTHDPEDPMRPWSFRSAEIDLVLEPIAQEVGGIELGGKYQRVRKAYGRFRGTLAGARVDDLLGFAERVELSW